MSLEDMTGAAFAGPDVVVEEGWGQGRATFGGVVAGLLVARMRGELADPTTPLRTISVVFVAPVAPGPARIEVDVLRTGKSATLLRGSLIQNDVVAATAQAAFASNRTSAVRLDAGARTPHPEAPAVESVMRLPYMPGATPDFFAKVALHPTQGGFPYSGSAEPDFSGWMRLDETVAEFEVEHLVALIDAWPPAITPMLTERVPASTLAWTVDLLETPAPTAGGDHWFYQVRTDGAHDGYGHTRALVWDTDGRLVATSQQTVTVFG
ncbi:thioesterase family protein [Kribbia dieselivorans]|uniref:thioesterase family protein n=1 Tax=Kribbia dieselivorans TaxID=331526 RepID=UPI00147015B7|nr:thioesterase family protein [Kribbia dieselivorans]